MSFTVKILPAGVRVPAADGENLLDVLRRNSLAPEAPCGGNGKCGKCAVTVDGVRTLACRTQVHGDMCVTLPEPERPTHILTASEADMPAPHRPGVLLAYDVGTTTLVCWLMDGETGRVLSCRSMLNPQRSFGADVISRVGAALDGAELRTCIADAMTELALAACREAGRAAEEVSAVSVVGNPAMQQLFMGIPVNNLAAVPFAPVITRAQWLRADGYLPACPNAELLVVPDISGYVGADTLACMLVTRMNEATEPTLMVDIGTNGEMVLCARGRLLACSTAAGPALEGAGIRLGMRAADGAIDHVRIENGRITCSVIGGGAARGICGSGLIDAVACALKLGLINQRGRIKDPTEREGERFIGLADKVYITQNDIRQLQLAKGAIEAGIELMCAHAGVELREISRVLLAGAFGSFMNAESAWSIGLLPPEPAGRVAAVGNAAGAGARLFLAQPDAVGLAQRLRDETEHLELASLPEFQRTFGRCTMLPN